MVSPAVPPKILIILHQEHSSPGKLGQMLTGKGFQLDIRKPRFGDPLPKTMDELLQLPGVARKTANVVLGVAYGIAVGIVVDTHVSRLSNRLGLTKQKDAVKIENDLLKLVPKKDWII